MVFPQVWLKRNIMSSATLNSTGFLKCGVSIFSDKYKSVRQLGSYSALMRVRKLKWEYALLFHCVCCMCSPWVRVVAIPLSSHLLAHASRPVRRCCM